MERLWIANVAPGTSDDELKALVARVIRESLSSARRFSMSTVTAAGRRCS
jgi:hypothetical protein